MTDPRLRFRLYLAGQLTDETWIDVGATDADATADATSARHRAAADAAESEGFTWMIEVFDPAAPPGTGYLRIGTDTCGMIAPVPLSGGTLDT